MVNLTNNDEVNKWANWLCEGKAVQFNEKKQTLERVGIFGRLRNLFRPKVARAIDTKVTEVVTKELRSRFEANQAGENFDALVNLSEALYSSKRIQKNVPEASATLERYLVGVKRAFNGDNCHYVHQKNLNLFDRNQYLYDPRLLQTSQEYAESHPDFVEFMLSNNIYYQMVRTRPENEVALEFDAEGRPLLPFAAFGEGEIDVNNINQSTRTWEDTKQYLIDQDLIKAEDGTLKGHHMTKWGLVEQHSFMWDRFTPITQIEPPAAPCFQIASYHPKEVLVPGLFDDQGHSGMVFVDAQGFVYSCGFYCHPDSNFYSALQAQASAIRSPDLYEARVDLSWQTIAADKDHMEMASLPTRWNDGILQFNFEDDAADAPCLEAILSTWQRQSRFMEEGPAKIRLTGKVGELNAALARNSRVDDIERISGEFFAMMREENLQVDPMTAAEKQAAMMGRVVDLQHKTAEAIRTGNWQNGALPYSLAENNCTHVSRYYFGQFADVYLGGSKSADIVNTRPGQSNQYLPKVDRSPISRWKWAQISVKNVMLGRVLRVASVTPFVGSRLLGRGKAAEGFTPVSSFFGCVRNFFKAPVSPQQVREEGMAEQFKISSTTRKIIRWFHRPSGMLPMYRR